jgi:DDT domain
MLAHKDQSLADLAKGFVPTEAPVASKKRKSSDDLDPRISRKRSSGSKSSTNDKPDDSELTLKEREVRALETLESFVVENGGSKEQVAGFRSRVTRKPSDRRYDINFFNAQGRRFRSMVEVGRFLNLIKEDKPTKRGASFRKKPKTSREKENEKKKLRRELERLRKAHQRAVKSLDDFVNDQKESRYPMEDLVLMEEEKKNGKQAITPSTCAAARIPDISGFPDIPHYCIPDLLMTWDFLCTFHKTINVEPISLDDFTSALTYKPPEDGQMNGDDIQAPPVFLAEAHLGLLKLLVSDKQSDDCK